MTHVMPKLRDLNLPNRQIVQNAMRCWVCIHIIQSCALPSFIHHIPISNSFIPSSTLPISNVSTPFSPKSLPRTQSYLCLCFGFLLQMIYTYRPFFLLTLLHPSHIFLTELRTFMPRVCGAVCRRRPLKRAVRSASGCCVRAARRLGRKSVLQAHVGVWMWRARGARREVGRRVRRSGRRRERGSILGELRFVEAGGVGSW
jgi:hypothetical protein